MWFDFVGRHCGAVGFGLGRYFGKGRCVVNAEIIVDRNDVMHV